MSMRSQPFRFTFICALFQKKKYDVLYDFGNTALVGRMSEMFGMFMLPESTHYFDS